MFHTVYNSFESLPQGRDYIGKHSTNDPYDDYLGSYRDDSFDPDTKIVIAYAKTSQGAVWLEERFQRVFNVVEDSQFANKSYQTSDKFVTGFKGKDHPMYGKKRLDTLERNLNSNPSKNPKAAAKIAEARRRSKGKDSEETRRKKGKTLEDRVKKNPNHQSEVGTLGGRRTMELGVGLFDPANRGKGSRSRSPESKKANGEKTCAILNMQRWRNTNPDFPPYESTPAGLSAWQRARGIDKSNRIRVK